MLSVSYENSSPSNHTNRPDAGSESEHQFLESLISEQEAAAFLGFAIKTLQNWRVIGQGPKFIRPSARAIRYRRKDLIAWAERHLVASTSEVQQ